MKKNRVALIEFLKYHDEVLPSFSEAFRRLGWEVDVLTTPENLRRDPYALVDRKPFRLRPLVPVRRLLIKWGFPSFLGFRYNLLVMNSVEPEILLKVARRLPRPVMAVLHNTDLLDRKPLYAQTRADGRVRLIALAPFLAQAVGDLPHAVLFPYFLTDREPPARPAGAVTTFVVQGNLDFSRRNYESLFHALVRLKAKALAPFRVLVIGTAEPPTLERWTALARESGVEDVIDLAESGLPHREYLTRISQCDFLLPLIDRETEHLSAYYSTSATSSLSLAIGLSVIPIVELELAQMYGVRSASVVYTESHTLADAMARALALSATERAPLRAELERVRSQRLDENVTHLGRLVDELLGAEPNPALAAVR